MQELHWKRRFDHTSFLSERRILLQSGDRYGVADIKGAVLIPVEFTRIVYHSDSRYTVFTKGENHLIDLESPHPTHCPPTVPV
jgi:hypothetical protein